jgi:hypothetical protein
VDLGIDLLLREVINDNPDLRSVTPAKSPLQSGIGGQDFTNLAAYGEIFPGPVAQFFGELFEGGYPLGERTFGA